MLLTEEIYISPSQGGIVELWSSMEDIYIKTELCSEDGSSLSNSQVDNNTNKETYNNESYR